MVLGPISMRHARGIALASTILAAPIDTGLQVELSDQHIRLEHEFIACCGQNLLCKVDLVVLAQRSADLEPGCLGKGKSHAAADDEFVDLWEEVVDH